ncbi:MAG: sulfatase-like hydrolase/transferase [bacterium]|nr:sulfatase-like hydrolase/transferase [bacterium]
MSKRALELSLLLLSALGVAACRGSGETARELPLVDAFHSPDVLTESRDPEPPPAVSGNRFVKGWRFRSAPEGVRIMADPGGSRLEIVNLEARERHLRLRTKNAGVAADAQVEVRVADREAGSFPWARSLDIPLPVDLPVGRVPLDLRFPEGAEVVLEGSGLDQALPPGEVELAEDEVVQSGWSLVDFVRPVPGESVLLGRFVPPEDARPQQRFELRIERENEESAVVFAWQDGWMERLRGARRIAVPLGPQDGLVRIRLRAEGDGPAARWQRLRIRVPGRESAESASEPPAAPQVVVFYILDALRADHLGHLGGDPQASPTLDALASEAVAFTRHLSVAPNTLPSTKSLFTGRYFLTLGRSKLPEDGPETLAEVFVRAGYRTGGFSGNGNLSSGHGTIRGFEYFDRGGRPKSTKRTFNDDAERLHRAAVKWLDQRAPDERVFLYVHTLHPHNPFDPPEPFRSTFADAGSSQIRGSTKTLLRIKRRRLAVSSSDQERIRGLYTGGLAYNDARIGPFLEEIRRRYPPGEVLIVISSDHGEELFDHGGVLHGHTLYEEMLHIPLLFWWPARLAPGRVEAPTDNLDVHETLRALVGEPSALGEGRVLWDLLLDPERETQGERVRFAAASSLQGGVFMARSDRTKLIWAPRIGVHCGMGGGRGRSHDPEYLFDLVSDPGEMVNRAGDRSLEAAWLRSRLRAWIERGKALETGVEVTDLDEDTEERLRALGYIE